MSLDIGISDKKMTVPYPAMRFSFDPYEGGDIPIRPSGAPPDPYDPADPSNADNNSGSSDSKKKGVDGVDELALQEGMARMRYLASPTPARLEQWERAEQAVEAAKSAVPFDVAPPARMLPPSPSSSSSSTG